MTAASKLSWLGIRIVSNRPSFIHTAHDLIKYHMIRICFIYELNIMGIVKISEQMHENLRLTSAAMSRSINAQADHWLRVGMVAESNPALGYHEICQQLIRAEQAASLAGTPPSSTVLVVAA